MKCCQEADKQGPVTRSSGVGPTEVGGGRGGQPRSADPTFGLEEHACQGRAGTASALEPGGKGWGSGARVSPSPFLGGECHSALSVLEGLQHGSESRPLGFRSHVAAGGVAGNCSCPGQESDGRAEEQGGSWETHGAAQTAPVDRLQS